MSASTGRAWLTRIIVGICWVGVAVLPIAAGLDGLRLAYGLTGTPGKATAVSCADNGYEDETDCRGTFTATGDETAGGEAAKVSGVQIRSRAREGETFSAQLTSDRDLMEPADVRGRLVALALPAMGVLFLVPLPWVVWNMARGRTLTGRQFNAMGIVAAVPGGLAIIGFVADNF